MNPEIIFKTSLSLSLIAEELFLLFYGKKAEKIVVVDNRDQANKGIYGQLSATAHGFDDEYLMVTSTGQVFAQIEARDSSSDQRYLQLREISSLIPVKNKINQFLLSFCLSPNITDSLLSSASEDQLLLL